MLIPFVAVQQVYLVSKKPELLKLFYQTNDSQVSPCIQNWWKLPHLILNNMRGVSRQHTIINDEKHPQLDERDLITKIRGEAKRSDSVKTCLVSVSDEGLYFSKGKTFLTTNCRDSERGEDAIMKKMSMKKDVMRRKEKTMRHPCGLFYRTKEKRLRRILMFSYRFTWSCEKKFPSKNCNGTWAQRSTRRSTDEDILLSNGSVEHIRHLFRTSTIDFKPGEG